MTVDDEIGTSPDADELASRADLAPRVLAPRRRRGWLPWALVAVIVVLIGVVLVNGLGDAALHFRSVDEAVAERSELGDRRFRLQGSVVPGTVDDTEVAGEPVVAFSVNFEGVQADVVHHGSPPELFQDAIPVVLEGTWVQGHPAEIGEFVGGANDGWYFESDEMLVKHDNTYVADNGERIDDAEIGGER